jgi:hypothetical protein
MKFPAKTQRRKEGLLVFASGSLFFLCAFAPLRETLS